MMYLPDGMELLYNVPTSVSANQVAQTMRRTERETAPEKKVAKQASVAASFVEWRVIVWMGLLPLIRVEQYRT